MNKKVLKLSTALLIAILLISISVNVFAIEPSDITGSTQVQGSDQIKNVGQSIVGILQVVGIVVSVVVLIILGLKYMMGSAEEKAEYKKTFIPYIVGAVLIFGASALAQVIFDLASGIMAS